MSESKAGVAEEPGGTQLEIINALLEGPREQSDGSATDKESAQATIVTYLMANVEEFRQLMGLRKQVSDSSTRSGYSCVEEYTDTYRDGTALKPTATSKSVARTPTMPTRKGSSSSTP